MKIDGRSVRPEKSETAVAMQHADVRCGIVPESIWYSAIEGKLSTLEDGCWWSLHWSLYSTTTPRDSFLLKGSHDTFSFVLLIISTFIFGAPLGTAAESTRRFSTGLVTEWRYTHTYTLQLTTNTIVIIKDMRTTWSGGTQNGSRLIASTIIIPHSYVERVICKRFEKLRHFHGCRVSWFRWGNFLLATLCRRKCASNVSSKKAR